MLKKIWLLVVMAVLLSGCGGGGGSDSATPAIHPVTFQVNLKSPADGETGVALNKPIEMVASGGEVDITSLDPLGSNILVVQGLNKVNFTASLADGIITFKPVANYAPGTTCIISLSGVKDKLGNAMAAKVWSFTPGWLPDNTAPTVPANLVASLVLTTQVNLTWSDSTDNVKVAGYKIFRGGTQVGTSVTASFNDTGLTAATVYIYAVTANDAAGNISGQSTAVTATTSAAPATPVASFAIKDAAFYTQDAAQATFDRITGVVVVSTATANYWDKNLTLAPVPIAKDKTYEINIDCSSVPGRTVIVELKENGGSYATYGASDAIACSGQVKVNIVADRAPVAGDLTACVKINMGTGTGTYTFGAMTVNRTN